MNTLCTTAEGTKTYWTKAEKFCDFEPGEDDVAAVYIDRVADSFDGVHIAEWRTC